MPFCCPLFKKCLLVFLVAILLFSTSTRIVYATRTVDSATLNGASSVSVAPSASITALITVTTNGSGTDNDWKSTSWDISGANCIDHTNHNSSGTFQESFSITAPSSDGNYSVSFIAYQNDNCSTGASNTITLTNAITVISPTPTPSPTPSPSSSPTPSPTPDPAVTPTPTPSPSSSSSSSTSTTTYYPEVTLNVLSPDPTNKTPNTFSGNATIEQGTIDYVEFTLTDGALWQSALPKDGKFDSKEEKYTFATNSLVDGNYTVKVRAKSLAGILTQDDLYAADSFTVVTTLPMVSLNAITPNPTKNQTPTAIAQATSSPLASIAKVEISFDGGVTWFSAKKESLGYSALPNKLEDGNYTILARAFDTAGNIGESQGQILVIDTIPPIIGGGTAYLGSQVLTPNTSGIINISTGTNIALGLSMKGGVTKAMVSSSNQKFDLMPIPQTNLWTGNITFDQEGEKILTVEAIDGADNFVQRIIGTIQVENPGTVFDKNTNIPIERAIVSIYYFDAITNSWVLWEAESFGQQNNQSTDVNGNFGFLLPKGRYYLEVKAPGFNNIQSDMLTLTDTTIINPQIPLTSAPTLELNLPFFGAMILSASSFTPPDTILAKDIVKLDLQNRQSSHNLQSLLAPEFSLPSIQNEQVAATSFRGKKMLLTFFAPWSELSKEQIPILSEASIKLGTDQAIVAVALQESVATTKTFIKRGGYEVNVLVDEKGETAATYNVTFLPQHFLIGSNGMVNEVILGILDKETILEKLNN